MSNRLRHCWAQGIHYDAMPLGDITLVLEEAHQFAVPTEERLRAGE